MTHIDPSNHPANSLPQEKADKVRAMFKKLETLEPTEMFRVLNNRSDSMIYVPHNHLVNLVWELAHELHN